jgi:hypothetical protein
MAGSRRSSAGDGVEDSDLQVLDEQDALVFLAHESVEMLAHRVGMQRRHPGQLRKGHRLLLSSQRFKEPFGRYRQATVGGATSWAERTGRL